MNFEKYFRLISYTTVFCGFLSLWISGAFGLFGTCLFLAVMAAAWLLEGSRWQISEKVGTALIVLALPAFYFAWKYQLISTTGADALVAGILARMILTLTAVKLLQRKSDRDWIFLYLMSFFEVLLAAGLSISALYLASFIGYMLAMVCTVIAFEIRKTAVSVEQNIAGESPTIRDPSSEANASLPVRGLPVTAIALIVFIAILALPLFFILPRVGGAGFGSSQGRLSTSSGFSDSVTLGGFGRINQSDEVVMRVKMDGNPEAGGNLYFRGVALDTFDNRAWSKSKMGAKEPFVKGDRVLIQVDLPRDKDNLVVQTVYLEPLDTPILFALPRAVAVQGNFSDLYKDAYGAISFQRSFERVSYRVLSDRGIPPPEQLKRENSAYTPELQNYRELPPVYDQRIAELADEITANATNRYDKARAIESYLQTKFGYTLEQKAGGLEPLADFLFNVREGHCEYFASAMAIMLRTQGIATRIVNGFHGGEYNDAADVTVVRQRNAHAWVEVYFPGEDVWVTFDPTPSTGVDGAGTNAGIVGTMSKYLEALETVWIQYFVAYDNQGQRSLARTVKSGFVDYQDRISAYIGHAQGILAQWLKEIRGDNGFEARRNAIGYAIAYASGSGLLLTLIVLLIRKVIRLKVWSRLRWRLLTNRSDSAVQFFERMQAILAKRGLVRNPNETPLEFALAVGIPEAVTVTKQYNRVRFGDAELSGAEAKEVENLLRKIEYADGHDRE